MTKADLIAFRRWLEALQTEVSAGIKAGKSGGLQANAD